MIKKKKEKWEECFFQFQKMAKNGIWINMSVADLAESIRKNTRLKKSGLGIDGCC